MEKGKNSGLYMRVWLDALEKITKERVIIEKSDVQMRALECAAVLLEERNAEGAALAREAAVLRYHSRNKGALLYPNGAFMKTALETAIRIMRHKIRNEKEGEHEGNTETEQL